MNKKMEILLVEDDQNDCKTLMCEIDNAPDAFMLIGVTNNASRAFRYVIDTCPDVVILDLELHHGGGDGLEFLKQLKDARIARPPFILVTTNNISPVTHSIARDFGADFIMTKNQEGYSAKSVIDFLKAAKNTIINRKVVGIDDGGDVSPTQKAKRIQRRICVELNNIGISTKSLGYKYLIDAITMVIADPSVRFCDRISESYKKSSSSVERAMQNSINRAWKMTDTDDLFRCYTAKINSDRGVPTLNELIFFYARKITNDL